MKRTKKYYPDINLIRVASCIAVLLYHLNLLKGGYLAVCTFFVLSGYLSCVSLLKKEKFSFVTYYKNRFLKLYLPLIVVVLGTIGITSFLLDVLPPWVSLKKETFSVLLGYNNFWQLGANLDYFARHIDSPFMHLWYIAILLQFDILLPFLFLPLRKLGEKVSKKIPCIVTGLLSLGGVIYFLKMSYSSDMMTVYYHTFTRIFSLFFGLFLGFMQTYYGSYIPKTLKKKNHYKKVLAGYLILLIVLCIVVDPEDILAPWAMIIASLLSCRLIEYATIYSRMKLSWQEKTVEFFSNISYEVYLLQYPIIFFFQLLSIQWYWKYPMIILITGILSYLLHEALAFSGKTKTQKIFRYSLASGFGILTLYGGYQLYLSEDHTKELQELENQLAQNEEMMLQKQEEYQNQLKQEEDDWLKTLEGLENGEQVLKEKVHNMPIIGVGDSIMLGALNSLYQTFPNGYFDAKTSRTAWVANDVLKSLKSKNMLNGPVLLNLGSNGDCSLSCKLEILKTCGEQEIFWINVVNDSQVHVNSNLDALAKDYPNVHIIDWNSISKGHPEYFIADHIHLNATGKVAYSEAIYQSIYTYYLEEYNKQKEEILNQHEKEEKEKITFYGNDLLLNVFHKVHEDFPKAQFVINKDLTAKNIKEELQKSIEEKKINYRVVLVLDNTISLNLRDYQEISTLLQDHQIYIVTTRKMSEKDKESLEKLGTLIDFYSEISTHEEEYLMVDKVHLTEQGNESLRMLLKQKLEEQNTN